MKSSVRIKNNFVPFLTSALLVMVSSSFCIAQDQQAEFNGRWEALWQIKDATFGADTNDVMKGFMDFKIDSQMEITAYGYPGCLFSHDTVYNELHWKVLEDSLVLYNNRDKFNLIYIVQKTSPNEVLLQLMGDIYVTLRR